MNKALPPAAAKSRSRKFAVGTKSRRGPPKAIQCLLPVWGSSYIDQFLEFGLPTLLAPGNLPALAKALPCEFIILTSARDEVEIKSGLRGGEDLIVHPPEKLKEGDRVTVMDGK